MIDKNGQQVVNKVYEADESLPYLTPAQKGFCRLYLKYSSEKSESGKLKYTQSQSTILASDETFPDQADPRKYGVRLLKHTPKIQQYIAYLQEDAYETVRDEEGRQQLTVTARARDYVIDILAAKKARNFQAVASMRSALDNLIGKKRRHAFTLAELKKVEDQRLALLDAVTSGEVDAEEFKIINSALGDKEGGPASGNFPVVKIYANGKINGEEKDPSEGT